MNTLIESFTLLSLLWLSAEFIRFCSRHRPAAPARVEPTEETPLPPEDEPETDRPQFQHRVVPFRRPATRREPSDRELIELAKSCGYPGAQKWSYSRPLSQKHRAILLETWETIEQTKAG